MIAALFGLIVGLVVYAIRSVSHICGRLSNIERAITILSVSMAGGPVSSEKKKKNTSGKVISLTSWKDGE